MWSHAGIICTGETYKNVVKMTFAKGASLEDPSGLFNSSLEGNTRRAIDFHEGDKIDEKALKALIRAAVALNTSSAAQRRGTKRSLVASTVAEKPGALSCSCVNDRDAWLSASQEAIAPKSRVGQEGSQHVSPIGAQAALVRRCARSCRAVPDRRRHLRRGGERIGGFDAGRGLRRECVRPPGSMGGKLAPLVFQGLRPPIPFKGSDGKTHLTYVVTIQNAGPVPVKINKILPSSTPRAAR